MRFVSILIAKKIFSCMSFSVLRFDGTFAESARQTLGGLAFCKGLWAEANRPGLLSPHSSQHTAVGRDLFCARRTPRRDTAQRLAAPEKASCAQALSSLFREKFAVTSPLPSLLCVLNLLLLMVTATAARTRTKQADVFAWSSILQCVYCKCIERELGQRVA